LGRPSSGPNEVEDENSTYCRCAAGTRQPHAVGQPSSRGHQHLCNMPLLLNEKGPESQDVAPVPETDGLPVAVVEIGREKPSAAKNLKRVFDLIISGAGAFAIIVLVLDYLVRMPLFRDESAFYQEAYNRNAADAVLLARNLEYSHPKEFLTREGIIGVVGPEIERRNMKDQLVTAANMLNAIALCRASWTCTVELPNYDDVITEFWGTYRDVLLPLRPKEPPDFCAALERETSRIARGWRLAQVSR
jgi:hypothetical protein